MARLPITILLAATLLAACLPVSAWVPETRVRMADEAVRLLPDSLRRALESHREPLLRGMLEPQIHEDDAEHRPPWDDGTLDARVAAEATALEALLDKPTPFGEIAEQFGRLAHFIADAGFPPGVSDSDGAERYAHFAEFCESRRERFPLVFYGHENDALARGDYGAYAMEVMQRARDEDRRLSVAYAAAGDPPHPGHFDDRSIPFAIGSLGYSRTVTDIARTWIAAWERAGGDIGRTPYRKKETRGKKEKKPKRES